MYKIMISAIVFAGMLTISATSQATDSQAREQVAIHDGTVGGKHSPVSLNDTKNVEDSNAGPSATGLTLLITLVGFVLLSNRSAI